MSTEDASQESQGLDTDATVDVPVMNGHLTQDDPRRPTAHNKDKKSLEATTIHRRIPHHKAHQTNGMFVIWGKKRLRERGISTAVTNMIMTLGRPGTEKQYRLRGEYCFMINKIWIPLIPL